MKLKKLFLNLKFSLRFIFYNVCVLEGGVRMANVFNRYEQKFILHETQMELIKSDLMDYIEMDRHSSQEYYTICNVYFDTNDDQLINHSVSKPNFKEKLRLRCYSNDKDSDLVFLEIKKKYNGYVNKRRTKITIDDAYMLVTQKVMPLRKEYHNTQVLNEIFYFVYNKDLIPKVRLSYKREAYFSKEDPELRITFDSDIKTARDQISDLVFKDDQLIEDDLYILEIKTPYSIPMWLSRILTKHKIYPTSFSKYGSEFYNHLIDMKRSEESCLNPYLILHQHPSR